MNTLSKSFLIAVLAGFSAYSANAEMITFNGSIAEYTCSQDSIDKECKDITGLVNHVKKSENSLKRNQLINGNDQRTAKLSIQDIENKEYKVIVVSYN